MTKIDFRTLERHIREYAADHLPEEAIKQEANGDILIDTCFIDNDEINITELARAIAKAVTIRVD